MGSTSNNLPEESSSNSIQSSTSAQNPLSIDEYMDQGQAQGNSQGLGGLLGQLWAPYRKGYVAKPGANPDPFMEIPHLSDEEGLIVARGETVFCILNLFPYNPGHMMVIPYRQVASIEDLTPEESSELMAFTQKAVRVLRSVSDPAALNIGINMGKASGGSVPMHLHQHIVPRWVGDTSFMTVIADTKVLPELLTDTWSILYDAWKEVD